MPLDPPFFHSPASWADNLYSLLVSALPTSTPVHAALRPQKQRLLTLGERKRDPGGVWVGAGFWLPFLQRSNAGACHGDVGGSVQVPL